MSQQRWQGLPMSARTLQSWCSLGYEKTLSVLGGSFALLFVLSLFLPFDSLWTYLFWLFSSDNRSLCPWFCIGPYSPWETLPDKKNQPSSISWQILVMVFYLFHWPFFIIFSQHLGICDVALVTTIVSLDSNGSVLLYFGSQPLQVRNLGSLVWRWISVFTKADLLPLMIPLALSWMIGISAFHQPSDFDESLVVR